MKILIFSRQDHKIIRRIEQAITAFSNISLEQVSDRKKFKQALNSCFAGEALVVFFVNGKKDMAFFGIRGNGLYGYKNAYLLY